MGRPESWVSLPSFKITPGKTFFGLDKSKSHCFTLPKEIYASFIEHFRLSKDKLQQKVSFVIDSDSHLAVLRLAIQDRSKTRKLNKEDLPFRELLQLSWKGKDSTIKALHTYLDKSINDLNKIGIPESQNLIFCHIKENKFIIVIDREIGNPSINSLLKAKKNEVSKVDYSEYFDFEEI